MSKGKSEYRAKGDFFNRNMNSGRTYEQTKSDWKKSEDKAYYYRGEHLSGSYKEPQSNDEWCDYARTSEDA